MRQLNISKSLVMSVIALILVAVLAASVTFSWAEGGNKGYVEGNDIVISTGSNLTMRQDGKITNSIIIPSCTLAETSSADGRNYFFPLGGNNNSTTTTMVFREGTPKDVNTKYVSVDFEIEAGDTPADVYLGAGSIVQCKNSDLLNALRMSFNFNDGKTPIVFKPNQMPGVSLNYSPVASITQVGEPTTTNVSTKSYGDYYYKGDAESTPFFHLDAQETKSITLSIWLEGTLFTGSSFSDNDISVYIDFTTTVDDLVKYTFRDNTHGYSNAKAEYWVENTDVLNGSTYDTMMYIYDNTAYRYYAMEKSTTEEHIWEAYIPRTISNFTFRRYSIDIDQWWNEWNPDMSNIKTDPDGTHTFIAICGNGADSGTELTGCYGYWQDANDTIRVYIDEKNSTGWGQVVCKVYGKKSDGSLGWTSYDMTWLKNTDDGDLWCCDIKYGSTITGIRFFSSGNEDNRYEFFSTDTQYYFNGFATWYKDYDHNGKYNADTGISDTHWVYRDELGSLIYPST